jgi:hypothetical protein
LFLYLGLPNHRFDAEPDAVDFITVGKNPNSPPPVPGTNVGSWYIVPLCIIPDRGQVCEYSAKPSPWLFLRPRKQVCDVFKDCEAGSNFANKAKALTPQPASRSICKPCLLPCHAKVLAWKTSSDDINSGNSIGSKSLCGKGADIVVAGDIGPVFGEDFARERFDFAEGDGLETACSFKAKAKPSDAREKIEDAEFFHSPHPVFVRSIAHTPAEERAKRLAVQVRGEVGEGVGERHAL